MSDRGSFDSELDEVMGEHRIQVVTNLEEIADTGTYRLWLVTSDGGNYPRAVKRFTWEGEPLVKGMHGDLIGPAAAAQELAYVLEHQPPPLSMQQHGELADELAALVEQLEELGTELLNYADGHGLARVADDAAEAISMLELVLSDSACRHHPSAHSTYSFKGLAKPPRCRCGLAPECLSDEP